MSDFLENSFKLANETDQVIDNLSLPSSDSNLISGAFFSLALEHRKSVLVLVESNLYGSACALIRSVFEAYVKGIWFSLCATPDDITKLKADKFKKGLGALVKDIEAQESKGLIKVKLGCWEHLCSFNHGGAAQIARRILEGEISHNYKPELIRDVVNFASNYGFLAAIQLASLANVGSVSKGLYHISERYKLPWGAVS